MSFESKNAHPHDCKGPCSTCEREDIAERAAIQTEGHPMSADAWQRAVELLKARRRPGQLQLPITG
jgi:hypothetical protein